MRIWTKFMPLATLVLMALLSLADLGYAQAQGPGQGQRGQGAPGWNQGRGPGNPNCPYYPGYRNCPRGSGSGRGYNNRMSRGPRGNWQGNQANPQTSPGVIQ